MVELADLISVLVVMIVSACLFILGYASTWGPGIWILIGETFPTRTRAKQGALSTAANWYACPPLHLRFQEIYS